MYEAFFKRHIDKLKTVGVGQGMGICPFHDDHVPSLSCNYKDGLWKCHGCGKSGNTCQMADLLGVPLAEDFNLNQKSTETAKYDYCDENGKPLIQVRRYIPKAFRPYHYDDNAHCWKIGLKDTRRVLYKLPELIKAERVFIVEGEKDADSLCKLGLTATTNIGGALKWHSEYSLALKNKSIIIIPDNDDVGQRHADTIVKSLRGIAKEVRRISLPNAKDVSEWIEQGGSLAELESIVKGATPVSIESKPNKGLCLTSLGDLMSEPDEVEDWIVDGLLSKGGFSLIVAKPKVGKSTLARQLALCVARGEEFLARETVAGLVVYLAFEERRSDVRAHFRQMGATNENIEIYAGIAPENAILRVREMASDKKPILIIVDILSRLARIKDMSDYAQVILGLEPIIAIAREIGSHVCLLHHAKKGDVKGKDSALGSTGIVGTADTIIFMDETDRYRTISSCQRTGHNMEETVIEFDDNRRWSSLGQSKKDTEIERFKDLIVEFLREQAEAVPEVVIDDGVEGNRSCRKKALRELFKEGKLQRFGKGIRGDSYTYAIAGILVPHIREEPENQNLNSGVSNPNMCTNTGF